MQLVQKKILWINFIGTFHVTSTDHRKLLPLFIRVEESHNLLNATFTALHFTQLELVINPSQPTLAASLLHLHTYPSTQEELLNTQDNLSTVRKV